MYLDNKIQRHPYVLTNKPPYDGPIEIIKLPIPIHNPITLWGIRSKITINKSGVLYQWIPPENVLLLATSGS